MHEPRSSSTGLTAPGRALAPFRFPAFRAIWTANLASNIGSMIQSVAAAWLMTDLTKSHQLIALVQASTTLPIMLLALFAGAIADNHDRRLVMLVAQVGMLIASALLAALTWAGMIGPLSLLALTLTVGAGTALNGPAWQSSVRLQVGAEDLPQAISINTIAFNLGRSVGPAIGGILISLAGPATAFALNTLSYIALIVVLLRWRPEMPPRKRQPILASIATGVKFCAGSSPVRRVLGRGISFSFAAISYLALMPILVREQIRGDEVDFGLLLGAYGLGSIITALGVGQLRRHWGNERLLGTAQVAFALALLPIALTSSLPLAIACTMVAGGAWVATLTTLNVAMQLRSPEEILGRCLAIYQAITFGGMAIGSYVMGLLSDYIGTSQTLLLAAALLLVMTPLLRWLAPMPARDEGRVIT